MSRIRTNAAALGLRTRRPTRAEVVEHALTELSRRRALTAEESLQLEAAIQEQLEPRFKRDGSRSPRRYSGAVG